MVAGGGMGFYGYSPSRLRGWYMLGKGWGAPGEAHTWLGHMRDFMNRRVRFWKMKPDNSKLIKGTGWVLCQEGKEYLVVLPEGGAYTLDLRGVGESLPVEKLDPKTGAVEPLAGTTNNPVEHSGNVDGFAILHFGPAPKPCTVPPPKAM